jgi:hypothetical protein
MVSSLFAEIADWATMLPLTGFDIRLISPVSLHGLSTPRLTSIGFAPADSFAPSR